MLAYRSSSLCLQHTTIVYALNYYPKKINPLPVFVLFKMIARVDFIFSQITRVGEYRLFEAVLINNLKLHAHTVLHAVSGVIETNRIVVDFTKCSCQANYKLLVRTPWRHFPKAV